MTPPDELSSDPPEQSEQSEQSEPPDHPGATGAAADLSLEQRLRRLEEIVGALESDELELDRALRLFEEGVAHLRSAEKTLSETELRVEELLGDGSDALTRPFGGGPE